MLPPGWSCCSAQVAQYLDLADAAGQLSSLEDTKLYVLLDFYTAAGAHVSELQKARLLASCSGLNPNVPVVIGEWLSRFGLLPEQPPRLAR